MLLKKLFASSLDEVVVIETNVDEQSRRDER